MNVASGGMYHKGLQKFVGGMLTGFRFTSLVTGMLGWPSYYQLCTFAWVYIDATRTPVLV